MSIPSGRGALMLSLIEKSQGENTKASNVKEKQTVLKELKINLIRHKKENMDCYKNEFLIRSFDDLTKETTYSVNIDDSSNNVNSNAVHTNLINKEQKENITFVNSLELVTPLNKECSGTLCKIDEIANVSSYNMLDGKVKENNLPKNLNEDCSDDSSSVVSASVSSTSGTYFKFDNSSDDSDYVPEEYESEDQLMVLETANKQQNPSKSYQNVNCNKLQKEVILTQSVTNSLYQRNPKPICNPDDEMSIEIPCQDIIIEPEINSEVEVEQALKRNYKDRRDYCMFCEKDVSHFSRHLTIWHQSELEVQKILSFSAKSNKRKLALAQLRKQGNFISNRTATQLRPVKRVQAGTIAAKETFLPCKHCLGFYKKISLYRHTKRCPNNTNSETNKKRQTSQSDGQTALVLNMLFKHDELLKEKLFPRMRADKIALTAKQDIIICNYAYSYIKGRKSKGNLDVVRQNTRRLSKLLIFAKEKHGSEVKELCDILRPCYFSTILEGVNKLAKYNSETDKYESPTLAMNFGTLIKKCCDIAYIHLLQLRSDTSVQRKEVKIFKTLIESRWADEISAQAATNLNENRWNKEDLIPLSSDLKKLNEYIISNSEECYNKLKENKDDFNSYTIFKELLYIQILLLNRRRPTEVAQLKVQTYKSIDLQQSQENEFLMNLTETEKILLKTYHRIVIRGKRGRGVPILLSPSMKRHFNLLLEIRSSFITNNDFVFHTTGSGFIDGTKVLSRHAYKCGATHPTRITATRLRKHLATICQLLQFSESDLEQLSRFMGHTLKTHLSVYRMSDNMYQTAKVSKLLLLMANGEADEYVGKSLDEINIDLNPIYDNDNIFEQLDPGPSTSTEIEDATCSMPLRNHLNVINANSKEICHAEDVNSEKINVKHSSKHKFKAPVKKQKWSESQKRVLIKHFAGHIKNKRAPKKGEVLELQNKYPYLFEAREWQTIKAYIFNVYSKNLKGL